MKCNAIRLTFTEGGLMEITLTTPKSHQTEQEVAGAEEIIAKGKELEVDIKQYRQKRSLDANSYAWALISKIAEAWQPPVPKEEVYIEMLKRYGQREPQLISVIADAVSMVYRATNNHCTEVGDGTVNGKTFKHMAILIGSSQYDSKAMATLIEGIISECKDLNIETITENERLKMLSEWGE
jgi:hypothetical protein